MESLKGQNGKSALELLIEAKELPQGATVADLIEYLKGQDGKDGSNGASAYETYKDLAQKAQDAAVAAAKADAALKGLNEADTEAAIQAAKDANPVATQEQWLESLKGQNGKSALELLIEAKRVTTRRNSC